MRNGSNLFLRGNGVPGLNDGTVHTNTKADSLQGGEALDLFFAEADFDLLPDWVKRRDGLLQFDPKPS